MNIEEQIINNKKLIKELNTRISNLLIQKNNIENELSVIPDTEQNKKRRNIFKARINMIQKNIGNLINNKKNIRKLIYNLERNELNQKSIYQNQNLDKISSFLQKGVTVPTDEDVMDEYNELLRQQNLDSDEEKQDSDEEKHDSDEEKQDSDEEKHDSDEEKHDSDEEKQDSDESINKQIPIIPQNSNNQSKDIDIQNNTRKQVQNSKINKTRKNGPLGFKETLINPNKQTVSTIKVNPGICQTIFSNGTNINKKYFFPSEFPKLTKIKSLKQTISIKKGGKKVKSRKYRRRV